MRDLENVRAHNQEILMKHVGREPLDIAWRELYDQVGMSVEGQPSVSVFAAREPVVKYSDNIPGRT